MIKKINNITLSIFVLGLVLSLSYVPVVSSCTIFSSVGKNTADGNARLGQTNDGGQPMTRFAVGIFVNEKTGVKVIGAVNPLDSKKLISWSVGYPYRLNSAGVALTSAGRSAAFPPKGDGDKTIYGRDGNEIIQTARTAKEAIDLAEKVAKTGGVRIGSGGSRTYVDKNEAYLLEGYGPGEYAIIGPMKDVSYAHANTIVSPKLKHLEAYPMGFLRAKRAQELLDKRNWYSDSTPWREGQITSPYLFRCLRDHKTGLDQTYLWDNTGNISNWGYDQISRWAYVCEISATHPDLLSIYWTTPNFPPFSPFIPFFIGLNKVPPAFEAGPANKTDVFQNLIRAIGYNMEAADKVQAFWEAFEIETIREMRYVINNAKALVKAGDMKGAEAQLYEFTNSKCELAVTYAQRLFDKVSEGTVNLEK